MHTELELGLMARPRDHLGEARRGERRAPLRCEHEGRGLARARPGRRQKE